MWELDHKEGLAPKNWCFWTVVLEKTLESPLDYKEIQPVNLKGNQPWIFSGRTDAEAEAPTLGPPDANSRLTGKDLDAGKDRRLEEKGTTEEEMVGWHHRLNGHWVWASSRRWWRTGKPGELQSMGLQSRTQLSDWATTKGHHEVCCVNWPFHEQFLHSMRCCLIVLYPWENFPIWSQSSQALLQLYQLGLCLKF